jgi:hypothetical protein
MNWLGRKSQQLQFNLRHYAGFCLEGLGKTMKKYIYIYFFFSTERELYLPLRDIRLPTIIWRELNNAISFKYKLKTFTVSLFFSGQEPAACGVM